MVRQEGPLPTTALASGEPPQSTPGCSKSQTTVDDLHHEDEAQGDNDGAPSKPAPSAPLASAPASELPRPGVVQSYDVGMWNDSGWERIIAASRRINK